jgi:hypothetical protein
MARAQSVEQEKEDFQRFLIDAMPWGARLSIGNADFVADHKQGVPLVLVSTCTVLDVGLNSEGAYYQVHFGNVDVYGAAIDDIDPAQTWTVLLTDPLVELPDGCHAVEMLHDAGHHFDPERWLLINPKLLGDELTAVNDGKELY